MKDTVGDTGRYKLDRTPSFGRGVGWPKASRDRLSTL